MRELEFGKFTILVINLKIVFGSKKIKLIKLFEISFFTALCEKFPSMCLIHSAT